VKSKEEFIKERGEKREREDQARVARLRASQIENQTPNQSPNQRRLFEKMGVVLRVKKPE
jgi:hypothetical protein